MHKQPLITLVIPAKNSGKYLEQCLRAIRKQTYKNVEILIIDSNSTDNTAQIAKTYKAKVVPFSIKLQKGKFDAPFKRNFGVEKAKGKYVYYYDADMEMPPKLLEEIVYLFSVKKFDALVVSEDSVGTGIWARAKQLERRCYWGDDTVEAARVFVKRVWNELGGLDLSIGGGGDDWDMHHRLLVGGYKIRRTKNKVKHHEGNLQLLQLMKKRFMYGRDSIKYLVKSPQASFISYFPIRPAFIRNWRLFLASPLVSFAFVVMRTGEYLAGFLGIVYSQFEYEKK